jgi:hypothetical protein
MKHAVFLVTYTHAGTPFSWLHSYDCPDEGVARRLATALNERDGCDKTRYEVLPVPVVGQKMKGN